MTYPVPTSLPVPPRALPDRERIAAEAARVAESAGLFLNLAVEQDPEAARRLGEQIQAGSRRAAADGLAPVPPDTLDVRVVQLLAAADCFARAAAVGPDDAIGVRARQWVRDVRALAAGFVAVPAPSEIRPEVPRTEAA